MPRKYSIAGEVLGGKKRKKLKCPKFKPEFKKGKTVKLKVDKPKPPEKNGDDTPDKTLEGKKWTVPRG